MYRERPSAIAGAVVWTRTSDGSASLVLPDGCMDLLWVGGNLVVAGPDATSFESVQPVGATVIGLRFASGSAPTVLGVPAHALRDQRVRLDQVWPTEEVRRLEDLVASAASPGRALEVIAQAHGRGPAAPDPLLADVRRRAGAGERVAVIADAVGLSARQLQRRSRDAFGYGPQLLTRILRLRAALVLARRGMPLSGVAATCGYADQAHFADDVRALAGTTLGRLGLGARPQLEGRAAKRSTVLPSGSRTMA